MKNQLCGKVKVFADISGDAELRVTMEKFLSQMEHRYSYQKTKLNFKLKDTERWINTKYIL